MTDDLKQRLRERQATAGFYSPKPGVIRAVYRDDTLTTEALAYITNLEARLAAAVEVQDRLMSERCQQYLRAEAAEAGEDALAEALRRAGASDAVAMSHAEDIVSGIQGAIVIARSLDDTASFERAMERMRARVLSLKG